METLPAPPAVVLSVTVTVAAFVFAVVDVIVAMSERARSTQLLLVCAGART